MGNNANIDKTSTVLSNATKSGEDYILGLPFISAAVNSLKISEPYLYGVVKNLHFFPNVRKTQKGQYSND